MEIYIIAYDGSANVTVNGANSNAAGTTSCKWRKMINEV